MPKNLPKYFSVKCDAADGDKAAEVYIRGPIGPEWSDDGDEYTLTDTEERIVNAVNAIPAGKKINVRVNSEGGYVQYALGIYNAFVRRAADITTFNEGIACSSASAIMCAGSRAIMPHSSVFMIHKASNFAQGNADEMRKNADLLETFDKTLASIYAKKTGMSEDKILQMMKDETWMTGDEAKENKFADESTDDSPTFNRANPKIYACFTKIPEKFSRLIAAQAGPAPTATNPKPQENDMKKIIAALLAAGITALAENATEDQIVSAINGLKDERDTAKNENKTHVEARKKRVEARVQAAIDSKRVKAERKDSLIAIGIKNESDLDFLDDIAAPGAPANNGNKTPRGALPAPIENNGSQTEAEKESEIQALVDANRTEKDPIKVASNAKRLSELRGRKDLFKAPAQKN